MDQNQENNNEAAAAVQVRRADTARPAIVSGAEEEEESSVHHDDDDTSLESNHDNERMNQQLSHPDELYGENLDQEDEAWVYKHMRGGVQETISVVKKQQPAPSSSHDGNNKSKSQETTHQMKVLKPRNSDAVLNCPCCFQTVCMDCQQHERYENQYRAMFVMNIGVNWDQQYVYSERDGQLIPKQTSVHQREEDRQRNYVVDHNHKPTEELYYSVYCNNCQTQVAALNMDDEVYHFFGCLASA